MLEVNDLSVYHGDVAGVRGVSMRVREGTVVAVVGANAAGKTTLLRALAGQLPARSGRVAFLGQPIDHLPAHRRVALGLVLVPEGRRVFPFMTVRENLLLGAYAAKARREIPRTLQEVYAILPVLRERGRQLAGSLSGGQQQMLAIGRALMARPRLVMFDEPSLGLAPAVVGQVFALIRRIRDQGTTVLLVEQNVRQSLALADYAYVLEQGRIVREGPAAELAADPTVQRAYMGI